MRLDSAARDFRDVWDDDGVLASPFLPEMPVVGVPREGVDAYCRWLGQRLHRPCRLPTAEEWEKASRGADARLYPWGDSTAESFALTKDNSAASELYSLWAAGGAFPHDRSVYGAMDMAGNVREMTATLFLGRNAFHQIKGASAVTPLRYARADSSTDTAVVPTDVGYRCVFPLLFSDVAE